MITKEDIEKLSRSIFNPTTLWKQAFNEFNESSPKHQLGLKCRSCYITVLQWHKTRIEKLQINQNSMEIDIDGIITVPDGTDIDKFTDEFLAWIESKGYTFGGVIGPYKDEDE